MREHLPSYYRKSRVMNELMNSMESEYELLKQEEHLTENQFFVLLCDKDIARHEGDVGITTELSADLDTRRGRILSKLRGTGTVTKTMMKNVAASFVNSEIEIIEYASQYMFAGSSKGRFAFACNGAFSNEHYSFAANSGRAFQQYCSAFNSSYCYGYYSSSFNAARTAGRAIKCTAINCSAKTLTAKAVRIFLVLQEIE